MVHFLSNEVIESVRKKRVDVQGIYMNIVRVISEEKKQEVYQFRYSIYVEEMNRKQRYADHKMKTIRDPLDSFGHLFVALDKDQNITGTVRMNFCREGDVGEYGEFYRLNSLPSSDYTDTSITTRLMVAPAYRSKSLAVRLSIAGYNFAVENGLKEDFIDCNAPLDKFFERLGYVHKHRCAHPEYGDVHVMKITLNDTDYLKKVKSPFIRSRINTKNQNMETDYV